MDDLGAPRPTRYVALMRSLNVDLPAALDRWVGIRVAEGRYADAAEYLRDLVRRDQEMADDDAQWLKAMIDEGLRSGVIDEEPEAVVEAIIAERRAGRG